MVSKKVISVVGARPQFIKAAALSRAFDQQPEIEEIIVHSGQHYDHNLSGSFFEELNIPVPKYNLEIGSGKPNVQIAHFLLKFDEVLEQEKPDIVVVFGDTNTTAAAAIAAAKRNIKIAHVEAGLREFNKSVPEEINKLLTDSVTDLFFTPTETGVRNLVAAGVNKHLYNTGDISLDLLYAYPEKLLSQEEITAQFGLPEKYAICTCHRAVNTDHEERLAAILKGLNQVDMQVLFPLHPRTAAALDRFSLQEQLDSHIKIVDPQPFWTTQSLLKNAQLAVTDSGGIIKEAYFYQVPTIIIDDQTEWQEVLKEGWATIAGANSKNIVDGAKAYASSRPMSHTQALGDGNAGERIVREIGKSLGLNA